MGDIHRFQVTASFICHNFKPCRVADVAGGSGLLSYFLKENGFEPSVIDTRKNTSLSPKYKNLIKTKSAIPRIRKSFTNKMVEDFDLIVGLHPDEATESICAAAKQKSIVVIPCCSYWDGIENHGSSNMVETIEKFFTKNGIKYFKTQLPFSGKNVVLVVKRS